MVNSAIMSENLITAINMLVDKKLDSARFSTFATIVKVNNNSTIDAQPIVEETINTSDGKKRYVKIPVICNIPYLLISTPQVGQNCLLIHLDRSINSNNFDKTTSSSDIKFIKSRHKSHNLSDCVAIVGFKNVSTNLTDYESIIPVGNASQLQGKTIGELFESIPDWIHKSGLEKQIAVVGENTNVWYPVVINFNENSKDFATYVSIYKNHSQADNSYLYVSYRLLVDTNNADNSFIQTINHTVSSHNILCGNTQLNKDNQTLIVYLKSGYTYNISSTTKFTVEKINSVSTLQQIGNRGIISYNSTVDYGCINGYLSDTEDIELNNDNLLDYGFWKSIGTRQVGIKQNNTELPIDDTSSLLNIITKHGLSQLLFSQSQNKLYSRTSDSSTVNNFNIVEQVVSSETITNSDSSFQAYIKYSSGLIVQWGYYPADNTQTQKTITFPIAFSNTSYSITISGHYSLNSVLNSYGLFTSNKQQTGIYVQHTQAGALSLGVHWIAIGH